MMGTAEQQDRISAEELRTIVEGTAALETLFEQDETLMDDVEEILAEYVLSDLDDETWYRLYQALQLYLGEPEANYFLLVLERHEEGEYLGHVRSHLRPETWRWLRRMLALYGAAVEEAGRVAGMNPKSWKVVNRQANFDTVTGRWQIVLNIHTYGGDSLMLEETPGSALVLVNAILDTLNTLPPEGTEDLVNENLVRNFLNQALTFASLYAPEVLRQGAEETDAAEGEGEGRPS